MLQANFVSEINKKRKDWFYKHFDIEERSKIREEYYKYMYTRQENVFFFEWFEQEYLKTIQVIKNGEINIKDIQNIHSQLNYTNQLIHQMALNDFKLESKLGNREPSTRLGKLLIKPFKFSEEELKNLKIGRDSNTALEEINKKLDELRISKINTIKINNEQINKINKGGFTRSYPTSRNFYSRPTLPDIQFEEWELEHPSAFDGNGITEWNIDGMIDHQILRKTHEITMAASAYRVKHSEEQTIKLIVA